MSGGIIIGSAHADRTEHGARIRESERISARDSVRAVARRRTGRPSLGPRVHVTVRLADGLHARLAAASDERDLPINHLINRAVEEYLDALDARSFL